MTNTTRRRLLVGGTSLLAVAATSPISRARADHHSGGPMKEVKALIYDVFGTMVDWRTGVARESKSILGPLGYSLDWIAFADAWRGEYQPAMEEVRSGRIPFSKLDFIHRVMLERIRPRFGLEKVEEPVLQELNLAWHRLDAWPDVPYAQMRLRKRFMLAPCSNGNIALMADLARRNDFRWDAILGAEIARDYKPKPIVYLAAAEAFNLKPEQTMMVAAHSGDLQAARAVGLKTAFVAQPNEFGLNTGETKPNGEVDLAVPSFTALAEALGC
jgi:2-haloacid dehalogenase